MMAFWSSQCSSLRLYLIISTYMQSERLWWDYSVFNECLMAYMHVNAQLINLSVIWHLICADLMNIILTFLNVYSDITKFTVTCFTQLERTSLLGMGYFICLRANPNHHVFGVSIFFFTFSTYIIKYCSLISLLKNLDSASFRW